MQAADADPPDETPPMQFVTYYKCCPAVCGTCPQDSTEDNTAINNMSVGVGKIRRAVCPDQVFGSYNKITLVISLVFFHLH